MEKLSFKVKVCEWFKSEKGMIVWTSILGLVVGIIYATASEQVFSLEWVGQVGTGAATVAIFAGVFNRYVIAVNRENSGKITKNTHDLVAQSEQLTKDIHGLVAESKAVLSKREKVLEIERTIEHFEQFLNQQSYHDIRFPNLVTDKNSMGLEYTIRPVRHPETNEPVVCKTEMDSAYVIYVDGPANVSVMEDEDLKEYENSPIREGDYAFCKFFNDAWHLGYETFAMPYQFYMSGKVGPVEYGQTPCEFIRSLGLDSSLKDRKLISKLVLDLEGNVLRGPRVGESYEIYTNNNGDTFLSALGSPLKLMYYTHDKDTYVNVSWYFHIEDMRGYANGQKLKNIEKSILDELSKLNITVKQVPWYHTKSHMP